MRTAWRSVFRLKGFTAGGRLLAFLLPVLLVPGVVAAATGAWKWPTDKAVPVCWNNPVDEKSKYYADEQRRMKLVKDAVNDNYGRFSALRFSGWGKCAAGSAGNSIQIQIMWTDQRGDRTSDGGKRPSAFLGRENMLSVQQQGYTDSDKKVHKAGPGMSLDFDQGDDYAVSSALHEFGHALGYEHDHQQKGKADFFCKELHTEVKTDKPDPNPQYMADKRDSQSIMSYCPVFKQFWRSLTADDVRGLQKDYGAGPGGPLTKVAADEGGGACPKKFPAGDGNGEAFLHLTDGNCWACPKGYKRTLNPDVAGRQACERPDGEKYASAKSEGAAKGLLKTDCDKGEFLHGLSGRCYSCPRGYKRSLEPINSSKACSKSVDGDLEPAKLMGVSGCPKGSFEHGVSGSCFSCGETHDRTADAITSSTACIRKDWGIGRRIFF